MATLQWQVMQNPVDAVSDSFSKCYSFISSVYLPPEKFSSKRVQDNGNQNVYSDGRVFKRVWIGEEKESLNHNAKAKDHQNIGMTREDGAYK